MKPVYDLMAEHRLIERFVKLLEFEIKNIEIKKKTDVLFISKIILFLKTYADKTHHGKEEEILFKQLNNKNITSEHKKIINDLIADHNKTREVIQALEIGNEKYYSGNQKSIAAISKCLETIVKIYPPHIEKEDKHFFLPSMDYFNPKELESMQKRFKEFDSLVLHKEYLDEIESLEKK